MRFCRLSCAGPTTTSRTVFSAWGWGGCSSGWRGEREARGSEERPRGGAAHQWSDVLLNERVQAEAIQAPRWLRWLRHVVRGRCYGPFGHRRGRRRRLVWDDRSVVATRPTRAAVAGRKSDGKSSRTSMPSACWSYDDRDTPPSACTEGRGITVA